MATAERVARAQSRCVCPPQPLPCCAPQAAPPQDLPRLRQLLEHGRLLSLVDQLLFFEQGGDREDGPTWRACMAALSFAGLARLVSPTQLCCTSATKRTGEVRGAGLSPSWREGGWAQQMRRMLHLSLSS